MKSIKKIAVLSTAIATVLSSAQLSAFAADDIIYGTMNIPYNEFYSAELGESAYEIDAVTSATKTKVLQNGTGERFESTYNDDVEKILGVTYPVAISSATLDELGEDNYGFTKLEETPTAYKEVTVTEGKTQFSSVRDDTPTVSEVGVNLRTSTPWGDYHIDFTDKPEDFDIYYRGVIIRTTDVQNYALRHEQNIYKGELAWSSGFVTEEPHGNKLNYEAFESIMGKTIDEIVLITKDGYVTVDTDTYVLVKFNGGVSVENGSAGSGKTTYKFTGLPNDYKTTFSTAEGFTVKDGIISYDNTLPGSYTLTVSDTSQKYADISADFILSTDKLPVEYSDGKLVASKDAAEEEAANFISNIASVSVDENSYTATGKRGIKIIDSEGNINFDAVSGENPIFTEGKNGEYTITVSSTGYTQPLLIKLNAEPEKETIKGDANGDGVLNVRDAAYIARMLAEGKSGELPIIADYNDDGTVNVRDAAAIAKALAEKEISIQ